MEKYISLLRGINVGGKNKIVMKELKAMYEDLGFKDVITYIQSGNVVFDSKKYSPEKLSKKVSDGIKSKFGFDIPVLTLTKKDINFAFDNNPFIKRGESIEKTLVVFLEKIPPENSEEIISEVKSGNDEFKIADNLIYLFCPDGYGRSKLTHSMFESKLKVKATARNWKTVTKLVELTS